MSSEKGARPLHGIDIRVKVTDLRERAMPVRRRAAAGKVVVLTVRIDAVRALGPERMLARTIVLVMPTRLAGDDEHEAVEPGVLFGGKFVSGSAHNDRSGWAYQVTTSTDR